MVMLAVCRVEEIPDGEARGLDPQRRGQDSLLVVRRGDRVWVYRDVCPHEGAPMAWRRHEYLNAARDRIVCHAHGAQFDIESGRCILGPCLGESLQRIPHRIDANGEVSVATEADGSTDIGPWRHDGR